MKYKIMSSTGGNKDYLNGIIFDYVIPNKEIGTVVKCFGDEYKITQTGKILVLSNLNNVLTLMEIEDPLDKIKKESQKSAKELKPNRDFDLFLEDKTLKLYKTPATENLTFDELFGTLKKEFSFIKELRGIDFNTVFDYNEEFDIFTFLNDWNWADDESKEIIKKGTWGRKNKFDRSI